MIEVVASGMVVRLEQRFCRVAGDHGKLENYIVKGLNGGLGC